MEKKEIMNYYVGKIVICNSGNSWDIGIFTDKNIGGYGVGIRGRYFSDFEFISSISLIGNCKLYTLDNISLSGLSTDELILNIVKTRSSYCSDDPEYERKIGLRIEIEHCYKLLNGSKEIRKKFESTKI